MKTVTCKLPEKLDAELELAAREAGISKSEVLRQALQQLGSRRHRKSVRAFDLVKDLAGSVNLPADLLTNPQYMETFGA